MKAIVLAGGYATRLWPITEDRAKMLLPIGERTVIDRILRDLEDEERVDEVYVSVNRRFAPDFEEYINRTDLTKPQLSVEETTAEEEKFGVVGALRQLVDRENITDDLLVIAGDNLIAFDVSEFIDDFYDRNAPLLAAYDVGSKELAKSYGLVELEEGKVSGFQEKPENPHSSLVSIACYVFPAEAVQFEEYLASGNNPDEPGWYVQWLQNHQTVYAFEFDTAWFDIGTPQSYLDAVAWELDGRNLIADSATVENTDLGSNVHIMDGASVTDSNIDNSVVLPESKIKDSHIQETIVDDDSFIEELHLESALVGAKTRIRNNL